MYRLCRGAAITPGVQEKCTIQYAACTSSDKRGVPNLIQYLDKKNYNQKGDPWIHTLLPPTLQCVHSNGQASTSQQLHCKAPHIQTARRRILSAESLLVNLGRKMSC